MSPQCSDQTFLFDGVIGRELRARFDAGPVSSDGGVILLSDTDRRLGLLSRFAACFADHRVAARVQHDVEQLVRQRVFGLCLGYEDVSDHDLLRTDPLLAAVCGSEESLAGKSTLSRVEMTRAGASSGERYCKVELDMARTDELFVDVFTESFDVPPGLIVLDLDHTDVALHGHQEGRFFHGYYDHYCYLPLYVFSGEHVLLARLQTADGDPARDVVAEMSALVARIRRRWPSVRIVVRGDSGFCREELMAWCEGEGHFYVLGLARNKRLQAHVAESLERAKARSQKRERSVRVYEDFRWSTLKSWSRRRRVVAKCEYLASGKSNPRFVVTNLPRRSWSARRLYEQLYCARGEMENRIKEQQLGLFADRLSTPTLRGNQTRMLFSAVAYALVHGLRRLGLAGTELARAQAWTIRAKLLKIGAVVRITTRRIWVSLSSASPAKHVFATAHANLRAHSPPGA